MLSVSSRITAARFSAEVFLEFTVYVLSTCKHMKRMFRSVVIKIIKLLVAYGFV